MTMTLNSLFSPAFSLCTAPYTGAIIARAGNESANEIAIWCLRTNSMGWSPRDSIATQGIILKIGTQPTQIFNGKIMTRPLEIVKC
jgi:hypothetical protein